MSGDPTLAARLGFEPEATVAVVHADDIGMCHAANEGAFETLLEGAVTCGSLMVPCPWFPAAVRRASAHPELDLGVHLTLNAEWEGYRWGPVAGRTRVPSLCAPDGGLWRTTAEVVQHARPEEVRIELRAQIERALDAGIDVTHIDSHMGTVFMPPFVGIYAELAREFRLPAFLVRPAPADLENRAMGDGMRVLLDLVGSLESEGFPVCDGFDADSLSFGSDDAEGEAHNLARLDRLAQGVHYLICHPARMGDELAAISDDGHCRDFERRFYGSEAGRAALAARGIRTVGMRAFRDLLRGE